MHRKSTPSCSIQDRASNRRQHRRRRRRKSIASTPSRSVVLFLPCNARRRLAVAKRAYLCRTRSRLELAVSHRWVKLPLFPRDTCVSSYVPNNPKDQKPNDFCKVSALVVSRFRLHARWRNSPPVISRWSSFWVVEFVRLLLSLLTKVHGKCVEKRHPSHGIHPPSFSGRHF